MHKDTDKQTDKTAAAASGRCANCPHHAPAHSLSGCGRCSCTRWLPMPEQGVCGRCGRSYPLLDGAGRCVCETDASGEDRA
jgi:hypothetical protein